MTSVCIGMRLAKNYLAVAALVVVYIIADSPVGWSGMMLVNTSWLGQSSERADQDQPAFVPQPICPV